MRSLFFLTLLLLSHHTIGAQTYADSIRTHRQHYKSEFLTDANSPLKAADTGYLRFYAPDARYRVVATFEPTPAARVFDMAAHGGAVQKYRQYGLLTFMLDGKKYSLQVYQSPELMKRKELHDYLFIPFKDLTNYAETYGGGRYLDLRTTDISSNRMLLDFNKAYNPYCAFSGGYACPIPPDANKLPVAIRAGEKTFGKEVKE